MIRPRVALITVACMLPVLVALTHLGRTRIDTWMTQADGSIVFLGSTEVPNDNGDGVENWLCSGIIAPGCGRWCGACHINGEDKSNQVYTVARHEQRYFPAATMKLSEGEALSWATGGGQLLMHSGQIDYVLKDGTVYLKAPVGSMVLKDRRGTPFLLRMPGKPTFKPSSR